MAVHNITRINCQFCNAAFGVPVEHITEEGRSIICPNCHRELFVQKNQFEKFFEYSMHCPKCGEFQNASEECTYCNVIIRKFLANKGLEPAWDTLSKRFNVKDPTPKDPCSLNPASELIIQCPTCGFSKKLSKHGCPSYITRLGCPGCNHAFDIVSWMRI